MASLFGLVLVSHDSILAQTDNDDQNKVNPIEIVDIIRSILNQSLTEFKAGNYTGAENLADIAYIDNYEYIEDPVEALDKDLMEETEIMIREDFSNALENKIALEETNKLFANIMINLDKIEELFTNSR